MLNQSQRHLETNPHFIPCLNTVPSRNLWGDPLAISPRRPLETAPNKRHVAAQPATGPLSDTKGKTIRCWSKLSARCQNTRFLPSKWPEVFQFLFLPADRSHGCGSNRTFCLQEEKAANMAWNSTALLPPKLRTSQLGPQFITPLIRRGPNKLHSKKG